VIIGVYTSRLGAGLGLIEETDTLLTIWQPTMSPMDLYETALASGKFPNISARRLKDVIGEGFASRYLVDRAGPAVLLKRLRPILSPADFRQLLLIYTARTHEILADFISQVYWATYAAGRIELGREAALQFVQRSNQDGKTTKYWAESTVRRVASYLLGCCVDFGLAEAGKNQSVVNLLPFRLKNKSAVILAYELHFAGLGDNAVVNSPDWQLFGLAPQDVVEQLRTLARDGHFIVQAAGGVINISWKHQTMDEVIHAIG